MEKHKVSSSNLISIGYEAQSKILEIEFNHGGVYHYYDVPNSIYKGLMNASSHGQYFDRNIKKSGYRYVKV
jgi:hypothetical protein